MTESIAWPRKTRELHSHDFDSTIWNDFRFRDDDIVIATWRGIRHLPNVMLVHYAELKRDLPGQMRRMASFLDIPAGNPRQLSTGNT